MPLDVHKEIAPNNAVIGACQLVRKQIERLDLAVNMTSEEFESGRPLLGMRPGNQRSWNWTEAEQAVQIANRLEALLDEFGL
ncbi:MAG: hypothetical protein AB7O04_12800 [Hyphomonadaceae bacterium]